MNGLILLPFAAGVGAGALLLHLHRLASELRSRRRPVAITGRLCCSMCKQWLPQTAFAPKQSRRPEQSRKCRMCVENYVKSESTGAVSTPVVASAAGSAVSSARADDSATAEGVDTSNDPLRLARKAETVLRGRTDRICLILENCSDDLNHVAVLRTCDALGVLRVWLVELPAAARNEQEQRTQRRKAAQRGVECDPLLGFRRAQLYAAYLDVRTFTSTAEAIAAARADGRQIWATDLSQEAWALPGDAGAVARELPARLALVVGSEHAGVSAEMLEAADRRVFLPMHGFAESLNLSVASALVLQRLLDACPESRGALDPDELGERRRQWYDSLARTAEQRALFARLAAEGGVAPFRDTRRPEAYRLESRRYAAKAAGRPGRRAAAAKERQQSRAKTSSEQDQQERERQTSSHHKAQ